MHAIKLPVTVRVEFRLDPQIMRTQSAGILELRDDLCLSVLEHRHFWGRLQTRSLRQVQSVRHGHEARKSTGISKILKPSKIRRRQLQCVCVSAEFRDRWSGLRERNGVSHR